MESTFKYFVDLCKVCIPEPGRIYRENAFLGVVASLSKWHLICNSKIPLSSALSPCGLCHAYVPDCEQCGLGSLGRKCTDQGEPFHKVVQFFRNNARITSETLFEDLDEKDRKVFMEMYNSVRNLCTLGQLSHFDSVFG